MKATRSSSFFLILALLLPARPAFTEEFPSVWDDTKTVFRLAGRGFIDQFAYAPSRNTLIFGGLATGGLAFADNRLLHAAADEPFLRRGAVATLGDEVTVGMSFVPLVTYGVSRYNGDAKLRAFSLETLGAVTLAYSETIVLSQLPTHRRPRHDRDTDDGGFFDDALRGTYSWPSGHFIGPFTMTLKAFDYYGWKVASVPAAITVISSVSRVATEHHYPSDIAAAAVLSLSAHLATRNAAFSDDFHLRAAALPEGGFMLGAVWEF